jgi:hypothetical protein
VEFGGSEWAVLGSGWVIVACRLFSMPPAVLCQAAAFIVGGRVVDMLLMVFYVELEFVGLDGLEPGNAVREK